jgi:predicted acyltransferase
MKSDLLQSADQSLLPRPVAGTTATNGCPERTPSRLQSLDALRGVTVALMILVNTSGDGAHTFPILAHSRWNGCTIADLVFPCFLFMVGISGVFSVSGRLSRGGTQRNILLTAFKRAAIIFALGLAINGFPRFPLDTLRIYGVLQRIALCYLISTALFLWFRTRTLAFITVGILAGYWALLRFVPVPGTGIPGVSVPFLDPYGNLAAWLDRTLIPAKHLYHQGFYDPEGLLSTIPALATTLMGTLTGIWIRRTQPLATTAKGIAIAGFLCIAAGLIWSPWFPWNKRLWTSSYVLWTGGIALLTLCVFSWVVDLRRTSPRWIYPATVFGTNALVAYVFSEFLASFLGTIHMPESRLTIQRWLYHPIAATIPKPQIAALSYAVLYVALCYLPVLVLYRRRIFVKV